MTEPFSLRLLRFLPRNLLSRGFGWIARRERPRWLVRPLIRWFARHFAIKVEEASRPLDQYPSLLAFFTRELKEGARTWGTEPDALDSPVDAKIGAFGSIEDGRLFQAKGMDYRLETLLGSAQAAEPFVGGSFATLYLSPRDYHRIHSPITGSVTRSLYEPGTLWPVNPPAVARIPALFAVNERVTTWIDSPYGAVAVVMVGATNVGSIRLAYDDFVTNRGAPAQTRAVAPKLRIARGQHVGTFELGSTVILLVANSHFDWVGLEADRWIPMGTTIGRFRTPTG